ncbi:hypothetical protein GLOIN_2v1774509 [Rhizophagus irregularis DAOM 181602=DAOM 197198]|nr:hypothetical protein GLOIN_2v1774509 [Rhizophagus irregularis DAOM 181602=DAOM 197198]
MQYNDRNKNIGIISLIETQENLEDICFNCYSNVRDESYCVSLEESLIKKANSIQHLKLDWTPTTNILSYLVNLTCLDINLSLINFSLMKLPHYTNWNNLKNISLPVLEILRTQQVPSKILANLIENTKGYLTEISICYEDRHPILLQTNSLYSLYSANTERQQQINNLVETYKKKGIVKTYDVYWQIHTIEDFEWEKTF